MALPQPAIEQLSQRPTPKSQGWFSQLLMFSATLLFITLVVYAGLAFGYKPYVNAQVQSLNQQIQGFSAEIPVQDQQNTIDFYAQLVNLQTILNSHVAASPVFQWLEANTDGNVYYTALSLSVPNQQLTLSGVAKTVNDANGQLQIFQQSPQVQRATFSDIQYDSGKNDWDFDATLFFSPSFFNFTNSSGANVPAGLVPNASSSAATATTSTAPSSTSTTP